jgi:hypothetical protein
MTDSLLTYDESADIFELIVGEMADRDPDAARRFLGLGSDAEIVLTDSLLRRGAWIGQLTRAVEVRCVHECDHDRRYAHMRFGLLACGDCMERFSHLEPREDGDCDICGADAAVFVPVEHKIGADGPFVLARACVACGELDESLTLPPVPMSLN